MSQHDMVVANADGATVRADINSGLQALASTSIGNAAPSTIYTGQQWIDNNTPSATDWSWFMYDGAQSIEIGQFDTTANVFEPTLGSALALYADGFVFAADTDTGGRRSAADTITFKTGGTDLVHFQTGGVTVGSTDTTPHSNSGNNPGIALTPALGIVLIGAYQDAAMYANREGNDGAVIVIMQDGTVEGSIDVAGNTVSYNAFAGTHWSQWATEDKPEILRGTVLSSIDALADWKALEFEAPPFVRQLPDPQWQDVTVEREVDVTELVEVDELVPVTRDMTVTIDGAPMVERRTFMEHRKVEKTLTRREKRPVTRRQKVMQFREVREPGARKHILYTGDKQPGDLVDWMHEGQLVRATVVAERNDRLARCKVSDVAGDPAVYGVFNGYDSDGDVSVMALGAATIRMAPGQTPRAGDLLESDGTGCARVQADDVVRSRTVAKVTAGVAVETYPDGSFRVPCTLMCG